MKKCENCGGKLEVKFPGWNDRFNIKKRLTIKTSCPKCKTKNEITREFQNLDEYINFQAYFKNNG